MMTRTGRAHTASASPPLDVHASIHLHAVVTVHSGSADLGSDIRSCTKQLPDVGSLPPGAWIAVELLPQRQGLFARAFRRSRHQRLKLATCCTALLAAGYERICVDEHERAFGRVPLR
ncbi:MAG: hypothetical protein JW940_24815 [Polyangiaceae bacterium]|nr:hypothetical protein [Polyangiaceae bacterium]